MLEQQVCRPWNSLKRNSSRGRSEACPYEFALKEETAFTKCPLDVLACP